MTKRLRSNPIVDELIWMLDCRALPLKSMLNTADLFMLRMTCKALQAAVEHEPFYERTAWRIASEYMYPYGEDEDYTKTPHEPMIRWCVQMKFHVPTTIIMSIPGLTINDTILRRESRNDYMTQFECAVSCGNTQLACDLYDSFNQLYPSNICNFKSIAIRGDLELIKHIDNTPSNWDSANDRWNMPVYVRSDVTSWLGYSGNRTVCKNLMYEARYGTLSDFRALCVALPGVCTPELVTLATLTGNVEVVKWLVVDENITITDRTMTNAIVHQHPRLIKMFVDKGVSLTDDHYESLMQYGNTEMLDYILGITQPKSIRFVQRAVVCNHNDGVIDVLVKHNVHDGMVPVWEHGERLLTCVPKHAMRLYELIGGELHPAFMNIAIWFNDIASISQGLAMGLRVNRNLISETVHTFLCHTCTEPHMFNTPHNNSSFATSLVHR
jgi:hypothetical protein